MKKLFLVPGLFLLALSLAGQTKIDSLIRQGIYYHDDGQYDKAIEFYNKALTIDPENALAFYEMAYSYMCAKEYEKAIEYSDAVIDLNKEYLKQAYLTKGSSLDYLGKTDESIKLFEKGLKKFGDDYLLYYNLGYDYYRINKPDKAEEAFKNAVKTNPSHASSHLMLANVMSDTGRNVESLLCLHYFLFLEPKTERSKNAYLMLKNQFGGNVGADKEKPNQINITLSGDQVDSDFGAAQMMVSMLAATKMVESNKGKTEDQLFIENTASFFKILGELKKNKNKGLWWDFYVPFFYDIANSDHLDTYCHYITQSSNEDSAKWIENNNPKVQLFAKWLEEK